MPKKLKTKQGNHLINKMIQIKCNINNGYYYNLLRNKNTWIPINLI